MRIAQALSLLVVLAAAACCEEPAPAGLDVIFVVEGGDRARAADPDGLQSALRASLLAERGGGVWVGLVDASTAEVLVPLWPAESGGRPWVREESSRLARGRADLPAAVMVALEHMEVRGRPGAERAIWVSTSGHISDGAFMRGGIGPAVEFAEVSAALTDAGVAMYAFASDTGPSIELLADAAEASGGGLLMLRGGADLRSAISSASDLFLTAATSQPSGYPTEADPLASGAVVADADAVEPAVAPTEAEPEPEPEPAEPTVSVADYLGIMSQLEAESAALTMASTEADGMRKGLIGACAALAVTLASAAYSLGKLKRKLSQSVAVADQLAANVAGGPGLLDAVGVAGVEGGAVVDDALVAELEQRFLSMAERVVSLEARLRAAGAGSEPAGAPAGPPEEWAAVDLSKLGADEEAEASDGVEVEATAEVDMADEPAAVSQVAVEDEVAAEAEEVIQPEPADVEPKAPDGVEVEAVAEVDMAEEPTAVSAEPVEEELADEAEEAPRIEPLDVEMEAPDGVEVEAPAEVEMAEEPAAVSVEAVEEELADEAEEVAESERADVDMEATTEAETEVESSADVAPAAEAEPAEDLAPQAEAPAEAPVEASPPAPRDHADVVDLFAEEATGEPLPDVGYASPIADAAPPESAVADDSGRAEPAPAPAQKKKPTAAKKKRKGAKSKAEKEPATASSE